MKCILLVDHPSIENINAIKNIADENRHELGFILRSILQYSIEKEEILVVKIQQEIIGFINYHHRKKDKQTTIYQLAIKKEYRRLGAGSLLLEELKKESEKRSKNKMLLKCPNDLESNSFFLNQGFQKEKTEDGRIRKLNVWIIEV